MNSKKILIRTVLLVSFIFILNSLALKFYWYSSIWYLDMLMHFLGGMSSSLLIIYLISVRNNNVDLFKSIFKIIFFVFVIGFCWEIFEIVVNKLITKDSFNTFDTLSDISFDLTGGIFLLIYYLYTPYLNLIENNVV